MLFEVDGKSGDVCISILHDPGEDKWGYERPEERWTPVHTVETIIVSVISMLADPNEQSPANVDAAVCFSTVLHIMQGDVIIINFSAYLKFNFRYTFCALCVQKMWVENRAEFKKRVARCVRKSQECVGD